MKKKKKSRPFKRVAPADKRGSSGLPGAAQRVAPAEGQPWEELPDQPGIFVNYEKGLIWIRDGWPGGSVVFTDCGEETKPKE